MQNFPTMGFGVMLTLKHVEKNALLCKRKPAKMQQVNLSCHSPHGHRQALPSAAAGETFSLHVTCIHPLSRVTQLLPLCQGSSVMSSHHSLVKGALVSPSARISEAQRCQVALPSHTASEDQSRMSPRCDSKPSALPTSLGAT